MNCGSEVLGRYCQVCGQENLQPKETFWHLLTHFFNDVTHFDGKFFATLKYLLFKPGFLSTEYVKGRRASYLHPIRMYVFTSAFFFLVFFSMANNQGRVNVREHSSTYAGLYAERALLEAKLPMITDADARGDAREGLAEINSKIRSLNRRLGRKMAAGQSIHDDTLGLGALGITLPLDSLLQVAKGQIAKDQSKGRDSSSIISVEDDTSRDLGLGGEVLPRTVSGYDSMEAAKPAAQRPWAFFRYVNRHLVAVNEKFHQDENRFINESRESVIHTFPKVLFVSLPLFAFLLRLLNFRANRRKQFYYVDHGIFTLHLYCATFIFMLLEFLFEWLKVKPHMAWAGNISALLLLGVFVYQYIAMHNFYRQGWGKTFVKFVLLNMAAIVLIGMVTGVFVVWAVLQL